MNRKWLPLAMIGGIVAILIFVSIGGYNSLVGKNEAVDNSWAQVQNVLQRRADLIPNLVATVKGYATHEKDVFENVANARSKLAGARTPAEAGAANGQLDSFACRTSWPAAKTGSPSSASATTTTCASSTSRSSGFRATWWPSCSASTTRITSRPTRSRSRSRK